ncbi:MAG: SusC/RagA family TonB-linked outer membrane protein [Tannerella sp.]|jgi:TonB-linked SusC/RagA family outer membrane protein|nr:SusC/RagA family TonB-linked outer membrane protein [Tannerella sp.]
MKKIKYFRNILSLLCLLLSGIVHSQNDFLLQISGKVSDANGKPLSGVAISGFGTPYRTVTNTDGVYQLVIGDVCSKAQFVLNGYKTQSVDIKTGGDLDIILEKAEVFDNDDEVLMGFSRQRRGDITGAVSTVKGEILERTPAANLGTTLAGRLAGLITRETSSEPSRIATAFWARGASTNGAYQPLLVIDGFTYRNYATDLLEYISAMEVESISLLKDASTQALYGIQGGNGVIVITTKRGVQRKVTVDVKIDNTIERPSTQLDFIHSGEYVTMKNQAAYNDGLGQYYFFDRETVAGFQPDADPNTYPRQNYPNNNWRQMYMKDQSFMQRAGINFTGGTERTQFFTNLNVMHQNGMWKTEQTKYNPNNDYLWANFRSNVDLKLHKQLSVGLNLSGNIKRERGPANNPNGETFGNDIYYRMFTVPPYVFGPATPLTENSETGETTGNEVVVTQTETWPVYAILNRIGFKVRTNTNVYAQFFAKLNLDFITQGLNLSGYGGYQTLSVENLNTSQNFEKWIRSNNYQDLIFTRYGTDENTPLSYGKATAYYYNLNFKGVLDYRRTFGKHDLTATAFAFYQNMNTANESLPYKRLLSGIEAAYSYNNRYLLKFDIGYSGTEAYSRKHRFTATPALSAGWVITEEDFLRDNKFITYLKPRISTGKTANDQGLGRYVYLDNISLATGGSMSGYLKYIINEGQAANANIAPETSVKQNYGIDLTIMNNLSISADIFREKMNTMLSGSVSTVPAYQGIPLGYYPRTNAGKFENGGYELSAQYAKQVTKKFHFDLGGWVMYAKNTIVFNDEAERGDDYAYRIRQEGYSYGQQFGYLIDRSNGNGFFNSADELHNSGLTYEIGAPRVGDLKYCDLNNDGIINDKDKAPLGTGALPRYTYALNGSMKFQNFDLSFMFQGIGQFWTIDMSTGRHEYAFDGVYSQWHRSAWTAERYAAGDKITYPALSTKANANHEANEFFLEDKSYIRLKNAEIGYTLPRYISKAVAAQQIRLYLNGQNLYTWHNLKGTDYGPEWGSSGEIISIPVFSLYNIGLSVKF